MRVGAARRGLRLCSKGPPQGCGCRRVNPEHPTGPQLVKVGKVNFGQGAEQVGLDGANLRGSLGTRAKGSAGCHAVIIGRCSSCSSPTQERADQPLHRLAGNR